MDKTERDLKKYEMDLKKYEMELKKCEIEFKKHEIKVTQNNTFLNHLIDLAKLMLHSTIYVNGGALISLLTFIGHSKNIQSSNLIIGAFLSFSVGLFLGLVACCFAFFAQSKFQQDTASNDNLSNDNLSKAYCNRTIAIICIGISILLFLTGCFISIFSII